MNHFTSLLVRNLLNNDHNLPEFESVLSEVFRQQLEEAVNDVLSYELEQFLGYERYKHTDKEDSRYGFNPRFCLIWNILRVRRTRSLTSLILNSLTVRLPRLIDRMYSTRVSRRTVSTITNRIISMIESLKLK